MRLLLYSVWAFGVGCVAERDWQRSLHKKVSVLEVDGKTQAQVRRLYSRRGSRGRLRAAAGVE